MATENRNQVAYAVCLFSYEFLIRYLVPQRDKHFLHKITIKVKSVMAMKYMSPRELFMCEFLWFYHSFGGCATILIGQIINT